MSSEHGKRTTDGRKETERARRQSMKEKDEEDKWRDEQRRAEEKAQKKAQAEQARGDKEKGLRDQRETLQKLRSATFKAARNGDDERVKKNIYEDNVEASGGEVKQGNAEFFSEDQLPIDPLETLLHIATRQGNKHLVEWLIDHNAEADEKNSSGFTTFHIALRNGCISIADYFITTFSPDEKDYANIYASPYCTTTLRVALESAEPEMVWMVLEYKIAKPRHISEAWRWICSPDGEASLRRKLRDRQMGDNDVEGAINEIRNLLKAYGKSTQPSTATAGPGGRGIPDEEDIHSGKQPSISPTVASHIPTPSASPTPSDDMSSPRNDHLDSFSTPPSSINGGQQQQSFRGRSKGKKDIKCGRKRGP